MSSNSDDDNDLFRDEAIAYQANSQSMHGRPTGRLPQSWWLITSIITLFIVSLGLFVWNIDFARKETVRGKLRVDGAEANLIALAPGVVVSLSVTDGSLVKVGDVIAEIETRKLDRRGASVTEQTSAEIEKQISLLSETKAALRETSQLSLRSSLQKRTSAEKREDEQRKMLALTTERLGTATKRHEEAKINLADGLITEPEYHRYADTEIQIRQLVLDVEAELALLIESQSQYDIEMAQISSSLDRELAILDRQISQLSSQLMQNETSEYQAIRSPIDGRVTALRVRTGETVTGGDSLAIVLPEESELFAELYLPSRAVGFVEPGQQVKLQYDAFPYQKFGISSGTVALVAKSAREPQELGYYNQSPELLFTVEVDLESQSVQAFEQNLPLQAGMELTADIVLEERRLLDWLLEPFLR